MKKLYNDPAQLEASKDLLPYRMNTDCLVHKESLKMFIQDLEIKMFGMIVNNSVIPPILKEYEAMLEKGGYVCDVQGEDRYLGFESIARDYKRENEDHKTSFTNVFVSYKPLREQYASFEKNIKLLESQIMYFKSYFADMK